MQPLEARYFLPQPFCCPSCNRRCSRAFACICYPCAAACSPCAWAC